MQAARLRPAHLPLGGPRGSSREPGPAARGEERTPVSACLCPVPAVEALLESSREPSPHHRHPPREGSRTPRGHPGGAGRRCHGNAAPPHELGPLLPLGDLGVAVASRVALEFPEKHSLPAATTTLRVPLPLLPSPALPPIHTHGAHVFPLSQSVYQEESLGSAPAVGVLTTGKCAFVRAEARRCLLKPFAWGLRVTARGWREEFLAEPAPCDTFLRHFVVGDAREQEVRAG